MKLTIVHKGTRVETTLEQRQGYLPSTDVDVICKLIKVIIEHIDKNTEK